MSSEGISRREFIKGLGFVVAGVALNPELPLSPERKNPPFWYGKVKREIRSLNVRPVPNHLTCQPIGFLRWEQIVMLENQIIKGGDGLFWAKIIQNSYLWWRPKTDEYVWVGGLERITKADLAPIHPRVKPKDKLILILLEDQMLFAYENGKEVFQTLISTGKRGWETPKGEFFICYKRLERRMQGMDPGEKRGYYDARGVPWCLYFTWRGHAIHGANWHNDFGRAVSHGCVNLPLDFREDLGMNPAQWLFRWSTPRFTLEDVVVFSNPRNPGTKIIIK